MYQRIGCKFFSANGTLDAAAANAGIQQIFRNFFGGTLGNVWPSLSSQYTTHAAGGTGNYLPLRAS